MRSDGLWISDLEKAHLSVAKLRRRLPADATLPRQELELLAPGRAGPLTQADRDATLTTERLGALATRDFRGALATLEPPLRRLTSA